MMNFQKDSRISFPFAFGNYSCGHGVSATPGAVSLNVALQPGSNCGDVMIPLQFQPCLSICKIPRTSTDDENQTDRSAGQGPAIPLDATGGILGVLSGL